jgi:DNA-binding SARP family transcriptional activator
MSRHNGFQRWRTLVVGFERSPKPARPEAAGAVPGEAPASALLAKAIQTQERLVKELLAATAAQQAALCDLYRSAGPDRFAAQQDLLGPAGPWPSTESGGSSGAATADARPRAVPSEPVQPVPTPSGAASPGPAGPRCALDAQLLGRFEVRFRGRELTPWPSQRAASLLKFLLLDRAAAVRREVLMEAFWPGSSPKSARNNLNVTIYQLRAQLRAHDPSRTQIVYHAGSYRIDPALTCRTDVEDFTLAVARARRADRAGDRPAAVSRYQEARARYGGPLLDDDTSGDWYLEQRRRLHLEQCSALDRLCGLLLDLGDPAEALVVAGELLSVDPCRESAHQHLMRAYAALEQPHLVVEQFRRCEATMRDELSVEPSPATVALYRTLLPSH